MLTVLGGMAEFERSFILSRTGERQQPDGRKRVTFPRGHGRLPFYLADDAADSFDCQVPAVQVGGSAVLDRMYYDIRLRGP
jgi:hypothetical protein